MKNIDKGAHKQAGAREQNKCQRDFGRDKGTGPRPAQTGGLARGFSKIACQIDTADGKHRSKAEENADAKRYSEGEREHTGIERNMIEAHKGGRPRGQYGVNSSVSGNQR